MGCSLLIRPGERRADSEMRVWDWGGRQRGSATAAATARRLKEGASSVERARESRGRSGDDGRGGAVVVDGTVSG